MSSAFLASFGPDGFSAVLDETEPRANGDPNPRPRVLLHGMREAFRFVGLVKACSKEPPEFNRCMRLHIQNCWA
jgi:hypothetical protein